MKTKKYKGINRQVDRLVALFCENSDYIIAQLDETSVETLRQPRHSAKIANIGTLLNEVRQIFKQSMLDALSDALAKCGLGVEILEKYKHTTLYLNLIPAYLLLYLVWLKINEFNLEPEDIDRLFECGVMGTVGYRVLGALRDFYE